MLDGSLKVWAQWAERKQDIYQVLFEVENLNLDNKERSQVAE